MLIQSEEPSKVLKDELAQLRDAVDNVQLASRAHALHNPRVPVAAGLKGIQHVTAPDGLGQNPGPQLIIRPHTDGLEQSEGSRAGM